MAAFAFMPLPAVRSESAFAAFVQQWDQQYDHIQQVRTRLEWDKIQRTPTDPGLQEQIDHATDQLYTTAHHETIKQWKDRVSDPSLRRWAEVLDVACTMNLIEQQPDLRAIVNHVSDRYLRWRPKIDGQEITYTKQTWIFRHEPDQEMRRKAFQAFEELGAELADATRQMFELRNEVARQLGYPTYMDLKLERVDGVSRQWLLDQFAEMERVTEATTVDYLRDEAERAGIAEIQPWDSQYLFDRDPWPPEQYYPADAIESNMFAAMQSLGLDSAALGITVHWYDSQAGGQFMVLGPRDIRILTGKATGMLHYNTAFHEYGHAAHSAFNAQPASLRQESGLFTEGMAMFMERWLHYPTWMRRTGVPDDAIEAYRQTWKLPRMYRHRRIAAMVMVELAAWDNPAQDLDRVFGETTAQYLHTAYHPRPFAAIARWTRPVQLQNYFIADLIASQVHSFLRANVTPLFDSPDAIAHVREHCWEPGNAIPWMEKIRNTTGTVLSYHDLGVDMVSPYPDV